MLPSAVLVQGSHRQHDMRMGIVAVRVMDRHVRAHPLVDKLLADKLRQQIDPFQLAQFNGQSHNELTGQSAVLCFLRFFHSVPELRTILPFRRGTVWEKDMLPDKALLTRVIMLYAVVVVINGGATHIGRGRASGTACPSADDLRLQMVYRQSFSPPIFFCFSLRQRESRAIIFDSPCLCDKAASGRFSQAEETMHRFLRTDNDDRDRSLGSIGCRLPQEPHPPRRARVGRRAYHHPQRGW